MAWVCRLLTPLGTNSILTRPLVGKYSLVKPTKRNQVCQDNFRSFDTMKHSDPRSPGSLLLNIPRGTQRHHSPPAATTQATASRRLESYAMTSLIGSAPRLWGQQKYSTSTVATLATPPAFKDNRCFDRDRVVNLLMFYVA